MMSSDPANTLPPDFDDSLPKDYDPAYTADISTKMRVPDVIGGNNESQGMRKEPELHLDIDLERNAEKYIGLSTPPRHLTIEEAYRHELDRLQDEQMSFDEGGLPSEPPSYTADPRDHGLPNGYTPSPQHTRDSRVEEPAPRTPMRDPLMTPGSLPYTPSAGGDDMLILRKQIDRLSRHVMRLEQENQKRSQRELLLYPIVAISFLATIMRYFSK